MCFFFSSRRRHTRLQGDWSSDVCSSDLPVIAVEAAAPDIVRRAHLPSTIANMDPRDSSGAGEFLIRNNTGSDCSIRMVRDRKSTRLNSSHLVISYAVFCLKKKKYMSA